MEFDADVEACMKALFRRCPTLCGFSVRDAEHPPFVTEICLYPLNPASAPALCEEVAATLAGLLDLCPGASGQLRGRTFARVLH
jgi:hypothetical protein